MTHFFAGAQVAYDVALGKKCVICHTLLCDMTQFAWPFLQYMGVAPRAIDNGGLSAFNQRIVSMDFF